MSRRKTHSFKSFVASLSDSIPSVVVCLSADADNNNAIHLLKTIREYENALIYKTAISEQVAFQRTDNGNATILGRTHDIAGDLINFYTAFQQSSGSLLDDFNAEAAVEKLVEDTRAAAQALKETRQEKGEASRFQMRHASRHAIELPDDRHKPVVPDRSR